MQKEGVCNAFAIGRFGLSDNSEDRYYSNYTELVWSGRNSESLDDCGYQWRGCSRSCAAF